MMYYQKLKDALLAEVPYPSKLRETMSQTSAWREFCSLPQETKEQFAFPDHQDVWDAGYKMRERAKGREDKEYFHITGKNEEFLSYYGLDKTIQENAVLNDFFTFTDKVWDQASALVLEIGKELDKDIPGLYAQLVKGKDKQLLRLLHYIPKKDDDMSLADQHFDRSGFTLHLFESHHGLQYLDFNNEWKDAPIKEGETIVFNGYQMEVITNGKVQKTWHRVVRKQEYRPGETRISMVLFVPFVDTPSYPKETRSQDMVAGYKSIDSAL
jgi:isopenicillin N synthase-like dioxygenase